LELFGDRIKDDKAMIGGLGQIDGQSFMIVGQKGINTKMRIEIWMAIQKAIEKRCV
jgi:acetyl-CoA carboxylase carboxyl transferase subunit alpha